MPAINQDVGVAEPFIQGDSQTLTIPVTEPDPDHLGPPGEAPQIPIDIGGTDIRYEVHRSIGGVPVGEALVTKAVGSGITILAAAPGEDFPNKFQVALLPADSEDLDGTYYHEAEVTFVGGVVSTVLIGRWVIQRAGIKPAA